MTLNYDVIIIGGGGSGLAAAISAATSGAAVLVIEKREILGGTTAMSVGSYSAANSSYQYRARVNDSIEQFEHDMQVANGPLEDRENVALRRVLAENAGPTLEWLAQLGVQFLGPTPEPPFVHPRMHNVLPSPQAYVVAMERECVRLGVTFVLGAAVIQIAQGATGSVTEVVTDAKTYTAPAVVLATGDYSGSAAIKAKFVNEECAAVPAVNPSSTGDGFVLAASLGAGLVNMDRTLEQLRFFPSARRDIRALPTSPRFTAPMRWLTERLPKRALALIARSALTSWVAPEAGIYSSGAILVDRSGRRFANELDSAQVARTLSGGTTNECFAIFDASVTAKYSAWPHAVSTFPGIAYAYMDDYRKFRPDVFAVADSIAGLAEKVDLPPETLVNTVQEWNGFLSSKGEDPFGRAPDTGTISAGPFCALGPMGGFVTLTDGGLSVDTNCRVLREGGEVIRGMFAAGSTGQGGLILANHGLHVAWAMTSGRIAGRAAALEALG